VGGGIKVWQTKDWKLLKILNPDKGINWLSFTPDANYLASAEADKFIRVWKLPEFILVKELAIDEIPNCIVFSPNGKVLAIGAGSEIIFWKFLEDVPQRFLTHDESIDDLVFSPNGRFLAVKSRSSIIFCQIIDEKKIFKLYIPYAKWLAQIIPCHIIAFSPNSKLLAIGDENGYVHLYKIKDEYIR
jgi:WD40 repeat protein